MSTKRWIGVGAFAAVVAGACGGSTGSGNDAGAGSGNDTGTSAGHDTGTAAADTGGAGIDASTCTPGHMPCTDGSECCSGLCDSSTGTALCYCQDPGVSCVFDNDCCSGDCNASGACT